MDTRNKAAKLNMPLIAEKLVFVILGVIMSAFLALILFLLRMIFKRIGSIDVTLNDFRIQSAREDGAVESSLKVHDEKIDSIKERVKTVEGSAKRAHERCDLFGNQIK